MRPRNPLKALLTAGLAAGLINALMLGSAQADARSWQRMQNFFHELFAD